MDKKIVLVTGITGKSGNCFLKKLMAEKAHSTDDIYEYRLIIRESSDTQLIDQNKFPFERIIGSLDDTATVDKALNGVHTVLHIAGLGKSSLLVERAVNAGVERLILVHTTGIYSKFKSASSWYLEIERRIEELLLNTDISLTILRPTMIYGTLTDKNISVFIKMVDRLRLFPIIQGASFALQPVHCNDLGIAYYNVLMNEEKIKNKNYNLSGSEPIDLIDILKTISLYLNKKTTFISLPFAPCYFFSWFIYCISFTKIDLREKVQRLVEPRVYSHADAKNDFGYSPVSFSEGVKAEVENYIKSKIKS